MIINYPALIDEAMHMVIKSALREISKNISMINEDSSFFISFLTNYPGVCLSDDLRRKYPEEMVIVLQYQFENLEIKEDEFSVTLYFKGVAECVTIPYTAVTSYIDKKANFALSFNVEELGSHTKKDTVSEVATSLNNSDSNVIFLDQFRTKK
jgi:hypothetical protein